MVLVLSMMDGQAELSWHYRQWTGICRWQPRTGASLFWATSHPGV